MVNVSVKTVGKREYEALEALGVAHRVQRAASGGWNAWVVTINGCIVVAFGPHDEVIFQDESDAVPDLIRAYKRVLSSLTTLNYVDWERIKRKGKPAKSWDEVLREWAE